MEHFITVSAYWDDKWKTVTPGTLGIANETLAKNPVQISWNSNMAMASMVPNVTFLLLNASFGHHFKTTPRLLISLIFVILLFGVTCAMTKVDTDPWQDEFWIGTIISIILININSAIFQAFIPLFLFCNIPVERNFTTTVFGNEAFHNFHGVVFIVQWLLIMYLHDVCAPTLQG